METATLRPDIRMQEGVMKKSLLCLVLMASAASAQQFSEWSVPVNVSQINSSSDEQHPAISKDGLSLYFASNRPGGCGGSDLWVSQRASTDSPWEAPVNLGCSINSSANDPKRRPIDARLRVTGQETQLRPTQRLGRRIASAQMLVE